MSQPVLEYARLQGERVLLRPVRVSDAPEAFPLIHNRRAVLDWLIWEGPETVDDLAAVYERWILPSDNGTNYHFALEERASGRMCGTFVLNFLDHPHVGDVGYWLGEPFWSRGLASEANVLAARLAFGHLQSSALTAEVFPGNAASCRVLEKAGYRREPAVRTRPAFAGRTRADMTQWVYSLTRTDFDDATADRGVLEAEVCLR